jgi:hypothetical protein
MERTLNHEGFGDSPRGGGAVWCVYHSYLIVYHIPNFVPKPHVISSFFRIFFSFLYLKYSDFFLLSYYSFGTQAIDNFLENNQLSYIIRAHEAHAAGVSLSKGAR